MRYDTASGVCGTAEEIQFVKKFIEDIKDTGPVRPRARYETIRQGWGTLQKGRSIDGSPLKLNGKTYKDGLGTHTASEIVVTTNLPVRRFRALAGVDDNGKTRGSVSEIVFAVEAGGKELWRSGVQKVADDPAKVILADGREAALGAGEGIETIPPFSFRYGGEESWKTFSDWTKHYEKVSDEKDVGLHRIVYRDPKTGLECAAEVKEFEGFPAAEWVVRFKNTGSGDTPILENIQALDLVWPAIGNSHLHYSLGSNCRVDDFLYKHQELSSAPTRLTSGGGRSSENILPFFNIAGSGQGMVIGLGWTGQWAAEFLAGDDEVKARAGMEKTRLKLHPGEEVRTPSVALVFWKGSEPLRGNNLLRRFILKHHTYRPDGKTIPTPITAAHPKGLRPISDAAKDAGMKFLLWFEPERATYGTPLTKEHPEWFLGENEPLMTALFNLGIPEARKWLTDYIEGLYAFWDELLRRNPGLIIDNCSSGGRRIDLETTGRSIPLWRSDVQAWPDFDPTAGQVHTGGLAHWVPCSATGTQMRPGDTYNFRSAMCTGIQFSLFCYERNPVNPNYPYDWHRKMPAQQRRAIPFFLGDYYPLTVCTTSDEDWMVYQMHREDLDAGFVLAFRRENSPFVIGDFRFRGLKENAVYQFEDADTAKVEEIEAGKISAEGFRIAIEDRRQSRLFFYKKK